MTSRPSCISRAIQRPRYFSGTSLRKLSMKVVTSTGRWPARASMRPNSYSRADPACSRVKKYCEMRRIRIGRVLPQDPSHELVALREPRADLHAPRARQTADVVRFRVDLRPLRAVAGEGLD